MTTADKVKQLILDLASLDPEVVERIDVSILLRGKAGTVTLTVSPAISVPTMDHVISSNRNLDASFLTLRRALKAAAQILPGGDPVVFVEGQIVHVNRAVPDALRTTDDDEADILDAARSKEGKR